MRQLITMLILIIAPLCYSPVYAYIGPGMGGGIIAATLGVVVAILAALLGILFYPIKRLLKNRKRKNTPNEQR